MSQRVPSWDIDDNPTTPPPKLSLRSHSNNSAADPDVLLLDYEVAELTWKNGQLEMHGLGPPRVPPKPINSPSSKYSWDKPRAGGTLESIVNEATRHHPPQPKPPSTFHATVSDDELVPWFNHHRPASTHASATMTMDALVPSSKRTEEPKAAGVMVGGSTRVGSCSSVLGGKRARVAPEWSGRGERSMSMSMSGSAATYGTDSQQVTADTCERGLGVGIMTSTSFGSQENTSSAGKPGTMTAAYADENDSIAHSRPQKEGGDEEDNKKVGKSSVSPKRSRAAAIHNQSERKRRDKINQRMKTLQKLVPNSSKTDKASMLDEVIEYLKQLQAQVHVMSRMNMQPMMLPMAMQQQLQMSMMAPMSMAGIGMGMGMGVMDITSMARPNMTTISPVLRPSAFMPMASWDGSGDHRLQAASVSAMMPPDPLSAFLACQSQPMTMDAYSRMAAAMHQQLQQQQQPPAASSSKS